MSLEFRHINILAPYLNEQEEEQIISEWSLMENRAVYREINNKLEKIAERNNIILPGNKIYSFFQYNS